MGYIAVCFGDRNLKREYGGEDDDISLYGFTSSLTMILKVPLRVAVSSGERLQIMGHFSNLGK